jgi:hypothetical protein
MKPLPAIALIASFCAAALTSTYTHALDWNLGAGKMVAGSGKLKTETRAVSGFTGISLFLGGVVEIRQGNTEGVTVETDDNLLPLIETVVEHGDLKIRTAPANLSYTTRQMKFVVSAKNIDSLAIAGSGDILSEALKAAALKASISGSGDIRIKSLEAGTLTVSIAGSGDFAAAGHASSMHARIAGSGDIQAENLEAKTVDVGIAGSGDATFWVRNTLNANVAGSGDVKYYGDARVKKSIKGSGSLERLGAAP